jgi:hypothetical protein
MAEEIAVRARRITATPRKKADMGRLIKIHKLPLDKRRDCRKAVSSIGPMITPIITGAIS